MKLEDVKIADYISESDLVSTYNELIAEFTKFLNDFANLNEAITVPVEGDLAQQLEELSRRFEAAKRGLGLTNKLQPGPQKVENRRRIMGNLNTIRAMLARVVKASAEFDQAERDYQNTDDVGSQLHVFLKDAKLVGAEQEEVVNLADRRLQRNIDRVRDGKGTDFNPRQARAQIDPEVARKAVVQGGGDFNGSRLHSFVDFVKKHMKREEEESSMCSDESHEDCPVCDQQPCIC